MAELPNGPVPEDLEKSMLQIMHDVGLSTLSKNTLRRRLEAKYKISFTPHAAAVDSMVSKLMMTPAIQRELAKIQKEKESVSARRAKTERSPSSSKDKKSKKDKKESSKPEKIEKKPDNYPKGALSPYIIFVNENREKVKAKNPDIKNTELLSEMGNLWKQASEEEKSRYQKLADQDKLRHEREMAAYVAAGGAVFKRGSGKKKAKSAKKEKDPNAPKRPMTAYFFFAGDYRAKHTDIPAKQQMTEAGAAWGKMTAEEKQPYEELAAKDKKRYEAECAARGTSKAAAAADSASSSDDDSSEDSD